MPRLGKQIRTPIGVSEPEEQAMPEQAAEPGTPVSLSFQPLALEKEEPLQEEPAHEIPPYHALPNFQEGHASGKDHDKDEMFREMMIAFREMAQTQRAMIKSIKIKLPNPELARNSPVTIGLNNQATSSTHQSSFEGRFGEDIGQDKVKSRPGKEKMYPEEIPQSWYEPVKPTKPLEIPKQSHGITIGVPRNSGNRQSVNPIFEPVPGRWGDDVELEQGYRPERRDVNPQDSCQELPIARDPFPTSREKNPRYTQAHVAPERMQQPPYGRIPRENQGDFSGVYEDDLPARWKPYASHPRGMGLRQNHYKSSNAGFLS
ncbi:hypothetical protein RHMOL_Rhmol11G0001300 [Rhododendron molle]|uniref:Uncharacterized protein n=1 Tax=Rhododendron molle TaxID=49168 RepID=A0ACC0LN90_RHOML|nr:hypothetical protein RHMOL_Rhmol11G0001300 [Rhododendron molle]